MVFIDNEDYLIEDLILNQQPSALLSTWFDLLDEGNGVPISTSSVEKLSVGSPVFIDFVWFPHLQAD